MENTNQKVNGKVKIQPEVIAQFAGQEAKECFGIVGMGALSKSAGIVKLLRSDKLSKGVGVDITDGKIRIDFHIIVAYGVSIPTVAENLREMVTYKIESFTGMKISEINIYVEGVRVVD